MNWRKWLDKWSMTSLKLSTAFLELEWNPSEPDKDAAWDLYIELLTRITTQPIADDDGGEQTALESIYSLFPTTRSVIKENGRGCVEFTKLAVVMLNQKVRPFTAKWHKSSLNNAFGDPVLRKQFRERAANVFVHACGNGWR